MVSFLPYACGSVRGRGGEGEGEYTTPTVTGDVVYLSIAVKLAAERLLACPSETKAMLIFAWWRVNTKL